MVGKGAEPDATCISCGGSADVGRTSCDACASERKPTIPIDADDDASGDSPNESMILTLGCTVVGSAASAALFAFLEHVGIAQASQTMKLGVGVAIGGALYH